MRLEGFGNRGAMKLGKGQNIQAFLNQKIRTEEAGYHLQKDNERLGLRAPKGPDLPAHPKPPVEQDEVRLLLLDSMRVIALRDVWRV